MRDIKRITIILKEIEKIWKSMPDLRLSQLLLNCDIFYHLEDDELMERLRETYEKTNTKST